MADTSDVRVDAHLGAVEHHGTPASRPPVETFPRVETIPTTADADTRIHIIQEDHETFTVWLDTEVGVQDGLCLAVASSREAALDAALETITDRHIDLTMARRSLPDATGDSR